jgi:hypothetical protein
MKKLSWKAEDALKHLGDFGLRPGQGMPIKSLWLKMGKDSAEGVEELVVARYADLNDRQTDVILTELGYRVLRGETRGTDAPSANTEPDAVGSTPTLRRAVIQTALEVETRAVLRHLSPGQKLPDRAAKYLKGDRSFMPDFRDEYRKACLALKTKSAHEPGAFANALASHMDSVVEQHDEWIDYVATNAPHRETRDQVILRCQSWPLLFSEKGREFCRKNGVKDGHPITWLEENY